MGNHFKNRMALPVNNLLLLSTHAEKCVREAYRDPWSEIEIMDINNKPGL